MSVRGFRWGGGVVIVASGAANLRSKSKHYLCTGTHVIYPCWEQFGDGDTLDILT
jgi:hypothetical protein